MKATRHLKVGLIGAGHAAPSHLAGYVRTPHVREVALAEPDESARQRAYRRFGIIKSLHEDYRELLQDPDIALIDICTPTHLHEPMAMEALQAGKHVLCESPLAPTPEGAERMRGAAINADRQLFCCLRERFIPANQRAAELLEAGEIGAPVCGQVTTARLNCERLAEPGSWLGDRERAGGGVLISGGHDAVTFLQHLLGPAQAVTASCHPRTTAGQGPVEQRAAVTLEFAQGVMAQVVVLCAGEAMPTEQRWIIASEGWLLMRDNPEDEMPLLGMTVAGMMPVRVPNPLDVHAYAEPRMVEHFTDCLARGTPCVAPVGEALSALKVIAAAYESDRTGQRVVISQTPAR